MEVPASTSALATAVATLASLVLELSWLSQVYEGQSDSSDRDIAKIVALAWGSNAMYGIWSVYELELVQRNPKPDVD